MDHAYTVLLVLLWYLGVQSGAVVVDAVQAQQKLFSKGRTCLSQAAIHQSLAMLQNLLLKIVLPYLTYLSPVCVQVISVQFTGKNQISVLV